MLNSPTNAPTHANAGAGSWEPGRIISIPDTYILPLVTNKNIVFLNRPCSIPRRYRFMDIGPTN